MTLVIGGQPKSPEQELYEALLDEVQELAPGERMDLVQAFNDSDPWSALSGRTRLMFRPIVHRLREVLRP